MKSTTSRRRLSVCGTSSFGVGAGLIGVFGLLKGLYASNYAMVVLCQIGLAVAQPFILNAYTGLAAKWFPINERATATGLAGDGTATV